MAIPGRRCSFISVGKRLAPRGPPGGASRRGRLARILGVRGAATSPCCYNCRQMPRNWTGIRASTVLAILGSAVTLLFAGLMVFATFFAPPPRNAAASPLPVKPLMIVMAAVFVALSAWGVSTAIAIFRRRRWGRISILVFAVLLTFISGGGMLTILLVQLPTAPGGKNALTSIIRWLVAAFYGVLTAIGVWWLVLFNRARAKEYFGGQETASESARPLSVSVIAWYLLISAAYVVPAAIFRLPAMFFGIVVTGWATLTLYGAFGVAQVYLGAGLLNLRENARVGTIAYFCFGAANCMVSMIGPGYAKMIRQMQIDMPKFFPAGSPTAVPGSAWVFALLAAAFCAVPIFFMVRRRPAFLRV
jgi:hypothetical protein